MGIRQTIKEGNLGVPITQIISESNGVAITKTENVIFSLDNINEYKEAFNKLLEEEILFSGKYEDNKWCGLGDKYRKTLDFTDFDYNKLIYESLKFYCLVLLYHYKISLDTVTTYLRNVKTLINASHQFDINYIQELDKIFDKFAEATNTELLISGTYYLAMNPINDAKDYIEYFKSRDEWARTTNPREIPSIASIIAFSNAIEDYMQTADLLDKVKFYPVYLWWRITSIIPMRATEFLEIKRDCLDDNNDEGKIYFKLNRKKQKPNPLSKRKVVPICDTVEINKELYNIIKDYIDSAEIAENEEYLFPLNIYSKFIMDRARNAVESNSVFKNRMGYTHMRTLLSKFYDEVIKKDYDVVSEEAEIVEENQQAIVKLKLGDTRHLAFCSMMLQGFNPLTIASIGGHRSLDSQMNYHAHLDSYIDCKAYMLSKLIKKSLNIKIDSRMKTSRELAIKSFNDKQVVHKVKYGWCCSTNFPNDCTNIRCSKCSYFKLDYENITEDARKEVISSLKEVEEDVKTKIGFVKRYYSVNQAELESGFNDSDLKKDAVALEKAVRRKARIMAMNDKIREI